MCHLGTLGGRVSRVSRPCRGGARRARGGWCSCPGFAEGFAGVTGGACVVGTFWWSRCAVRDACSRARSDSRARVPGVRGCAGDRGQFAGGQFAGAYVGGMSGARWGYVRSVPLRSRSELHPARVCMSRGWPWWTGPTGHTGTVHRERGPLGPGGWDVRGRLECAGAGMWPRRPGCAQRARRLGLGREKMPLTQAR